MVSAGGEGMTSVPVREGAQPGVWERVRDCSRGGTPETREADRMRRVGVMQAKRK